MGPEFRIVGRLQGRWPMQSVNKYTDKGHGVKENCPCQESKRWEGGGDEGGSKGRAFSLNQCLPSTSALDTAVPVTPAWKPTLFPAT